MTENLIHPSSYIQSPRIGARSRFWQFVVVLPDAIIGNDCNICSHCLIENDVIIGDRVTVKSGVQLWDGVRLEDDVFIGPNVTFSNDKYPRSKMYPESFMQTVVQKGASVGAGAVLLPGVTIGGYAMVGAGSVVTRSVPPNAIVVGNPARIIGYVNSQDVSVSKLNGNDQLGFTETRVKGVSLHVLRRVADMRGNLVVGEFERSVPFDVKRYFMIFDVPSAETRGEHAHIECQQFLVCVKGRCAVVADDGVNRQEFILDRPDLGIYLPPMVWGIQYKYTQDAILLVFASHYYDEADYIRNYSEFCQLAGHNS